MFNENASPNTQMTVSNWMLGRYKKNACFHFAGKLRTIKSTSEPKFNNACRDILAKESSLIIHNVKQQPVTSNNRIMSQET